MTALKGIATISPGEPAELAFVVIDGVQLPERRFAERVQLTALARVSAPGDGDDGAAVETTAANVSAGGVLLERHAGLGEGPRYRLELTVAGDDAPIRCDATVARETPTHIALKFIDIQDADRIRLAGMIRHQALGAALAVRARLQLEQLRVRPAGGHQLLVRARLAHEAIARAR